MASVVFEVDEADLPLLEQLVRRFGRGDRSEFLRVAMQRMRHDLFAKRMRGLQASVRKDLGGRVISIDEVLGRG